MTTARELPPTEAQLSTWLENAMTNGWLLTCDYEETRKFSLEAPDGTEYTGDYLREVIREAQRHE